MVKRAKSALFNYFAAVLQNTLQIFVVRFAVALTRRIDFILQPGIGSCSDDHAGDGKENFTIVKKNFPGVELLGTVPIFLSFCC